MDKKKLQEAEEQIKTALLHMNYDSSKTLTENKEKINVIKEDDKGFATAVGVGGAAVGAGAGGIALAQAGGVAGLGTTGLVPLANTLGGLLPGIATGTGAALVAGSAIISAAVGLAVLPLIYWYARKDEGPAKSVQAFFQMCRTTPNIEKLERKINDNEIRNLTDDIYDAINYSTWGFMAGTDEEKLFSVFQKLESGTAADFCALNKKYLQFRGADLYDEIDSDIDSPDEWEQIYRPLRNCVEDSLQKLQELTPCAEGEILDPKTKKCVPIKKEENTTEWNKYPCVPSYPGAKKINASTGGVVYLINSEYYYANGRKKTSDGKMVNFTCDDPPFKRVVTGGKRNPYKDWQPEETEG